MKTIFTIGLLIALVLCIVAFLFCRIKHRQLHKQIIQAIKQSTKPLNIADLTKKLGKQLYLNDELAIMIMNGILNLDQSGNYSLTDKGRSLIPKPKKPVEPTETETFKEN